MPERQHFFFQLTPSLSHYRQYWQWCTFFKLVPLLASKTLNFGQFWPFLAILSSIYALVGAPITGLNSAVVPQKLTNMRYAYLVTFSLQSFPLGFSLAQTHFLSFLREESIKWMSIRNEQRLSITKNHVMRVRHFFVVLVVKYHLVGQLTSEA